MSAVPVIGGACCRRGPDDVAGGLDRQEFDQAQKGGMA